MDKKMPKLVFNEKQKNSPSIEITLLVRDKRGNPTGKTKTFSSDNHRDVESWYKNQKPKRKRKKKKQG